MKRTMRWLLMICTFALLASIPMATTYAAGSGETKVFLPIILQNANNANNPPSTALMRQEIEAILLNANSNLGISKVMFDDYMLSLYFTAPSDENLLDNADFENLLQQIDNAMHDLFNSSGYSAGNYDYEIFINDQLLSQGSTSEAELNQAPDFNNGITGHRIAISPGHGWSVVGSGWSLERGYHWDIVEDFINWDLVKILQNRLSSAGAVVLPTREMDANVGNHDSGHPWYQMGASEYVRSLGMQGSVWGQSFSMGSDRDVVAPPRYANQISADMLISIHNNGGGGCGTETWYDTSNGHAAESKRLADLIQNKLIERLRSQWNANWCDRHIKGSNGGYGENRIFNGPAVIVELAFMDNKSDNDALKNQSFRDIAMTAISDAVQEYYGGSGSPAPAPTTFTGSPSSRLYVNPQGAATGGPEMDLEVCADNLVGNIVYVQLSRPDKIFTSHSHVFTERCFTFANINDSEALLNITPYTSRAALNQLPNQGWPVPCYGATGGRGLCDTITTASATSTVTIDNGLSTPRIDANVVDLQVCADNLAGKVVYAQIWRDTAQGYPANTWNYSQYASGSCVTFQDMEGSGGTFANVDYYTVASLEPIGATEAAQKRTSCYVNTGAKRLCDRVSRTVSSNYLVNGYSHLSISTSEVKLLVCADNLVGRTVYAQMWRNAAQGYGANTWNYSLYASDSCVTFTDMDGSGDTFAGVTYYTVAALEPIGGSEASQQRTSCYADTGGTRLCDQVSR